MQPLEYIELPWTFAPSGSDYMTVCVNNLDLPWTDLSSPLWRLNHKSSSEHGMSLPSNFVSSFILCTNVCCVCLGFVNLLSWGHLKGPSHTSKREFWSSNHLMNTLPGTRLLSDICGKLHEGARELSNYIGTLFCSSAFPKIIRRPLRPGWKLWFLWWASWNSKQNSAVSLDQSSQANIRCF